MKKTLIALAALAAFGSASAEVVLYGKVDLGLSSTTKTGAVDQGMEVTSGNYEGSRFGIKGGSDFGAGVKGIFQLEQGINAATGKEGNSGYAFNRVAMVGLTGAFGTVSAGVQWTPYDNAWGWDQTEYNGFSAPNKTWAKGAHADNGNNPETYAGNAKNSIAYTTPDMSGFNATILYANGSDKTATTDSTKYVGFGANYVAGPLNVNFGYESVASNVNWGTALTTPSDKTGAYILGASYNLGVATVGGAYQQATADIGGGTAQQKDAGWTLGVSVPLSAQTTAAISYAAETTTQAGLTDGTSKGFGGQVIYNWTKQAAIYGGAYQVKATEVASTAEITTTKYAAGLRYKF